MTRDEASREIQWYERRWSTMERRIKELEAERDRLREALTYVVDTAPVDMYKHLMANTSYHDAIDMARAALQEGNDD